jgi:hypothetical protein
MAEPDPPVRAGPMGRGFAVRFMRQWQNYFPGDVATFPARMAAGLVSRRIARAVDIAEPGNVPTGAPLAIRGPGKPRVVKAPDFMEGFEF